MTEFTPDGFADTPGPDATAEQDAHVRALLAFLRDEPMELPPHVAARLDAVIAEERRTSAAGAGAASAVDASAEATATRLAPVTVLPVATRRGPSLRAFTVVGGLAAAALVVVGGITVLGGLGARGGLDTSTSLAAGSGSAEGGAGTRLTASGVAYTPTTLAAQASTLAGLSLGTVKAVAGTPTGSVAADGVTPAPRPASGAPGTTSYSLAAAPTDARALASAALTPEKVATCVRTLTGGDGTRALAVDAGSWQGKAALLVILPTTDDSASLDVFVVTRDCSPDFLTFQRIARP